MNELADRKTRADAEFKILREKPGAYPITFADTKMAFKDLSEEVQCSIDLYVIVRLSAR